MAMAVWIALVNGEQSTTLGGGERPAIACRAPLTNACPLRDKLGPDRTGPNRAQAAAEDGSSQGRNERQRKGTTMARNRVNI